MCHWCAARTVRLRAPALPTAAISALECTQRLFIRQRQPGFWRTGCPPALPSPALVATVRRGRLDGCGATDVASGRYLVVLAVNNATNSVAEVVSQWISREDAKPLSRQEDAVMNVRARRGSAETSAPSYPLATLRLRVLARNPLDKRSSTTQCLGANRLQYLCTQPLDLD
jgi:hypothetical protein